MISGLDTLGDEEFWVGGEFDPDGGKDDGSSELGVEAFTEDTLEA